MAGARIGNDGSVAPLFDENFTGKLAAILILVGIWVGRVAPSRTDELSSLITKKSERRALPYQQGTRRFVIAAGQRPRRHRRAETRACCRSRESRQTVGRSPGKWREAR